VGFGHHTTCFFIRGATVKNRKVEKQMKTKQRKHQSQKIAVYIESPLGSKCEKGKTLAS